MEVLLPVVPDLVTVEQAVAEYGLGQTSLYKLMRSKKLTRYKRPMDKRTYVDRDELRKLLRYKPARSERAGR